MIEAAPTVVPKSAAICGRSESVTRTIAWLAKPAPASRMMERVGTFWAGIGMLTRDFEFVVRASGWGVDRAERDGLFTAKFPERNNNDRQDIPAFRRRGAHLRQVGGSGCISRWPAGAAQRQVLLHR